MVRRSTSIDILKYQTYGMNRGHSLNARVPETVTQTRHKNKKKTTVVAHVHLMIISTAAFFLPFFRDNTR